jgi:predicted ATPase/DNA-binding CsgD family transcriptional regulator
MARPARRTGNLPAEASSFVGRRRELAEVRTKLTAARLISLVGPGGVGKTRLALRAATGLGRGFRDGAWLVELADVRDPAVVGNAALTALNLHDRGGTEPVALLHSYLRDKELLLLVDNCEHMLDAAAGIVTDVLKAAPGVRVIATTREPLSAPGEHVVPVPPLELPAPLAAAAPHAAPHPADPHPADLLAELRHNEAIALFVARAAAASGSFELTAANQAQVAELCRRLDGLPLAIELAAVRARVLTVEQILDRLTDRFGLLTGGSRAALPRHQTLRTTIDWSHDLLSDGERAVLRRCCAFAGMFTLADAEAVCTSADGPAKQVLDLLSSLVDKSLVVKEEAAGVACFRLHETMREFAALKLAEAGEVEALGLRCAGYYQSACQRSALEGRYRLLEWLPWADLEIDNIRAVLQWCRSRADTARGLELAVSLGWYWITRAATEGMRWLEEFQAGEGGDPYLRAWAWFIRGFLAVLKADPVSAGPLLQLAVAAARRDGYPDVLADALAMSSIAASMAGDRASARRLLDEARAHTSTLDYPPGKLAVLQAQALNGLFEAHLDAVRSAATEGVHLARETGDTYGLEMMLLNLGSAALLGGNAGEARPLLAEALEIADQIDDQVAQVYLLGAFGTLAALAGQARRAAQLLGAADTARTRVGAGVMPFLAPSLGQAQQRTAAALGTARFAAEFASGKSLPRDAALRLALGKPAPAAAGPRDAGDRLLGKREADVARLVAGGLTNKQIGAQLFISERTVDSHVRSILTKLGFSSRAQIAAWRASRPD